MAKQLSSVYTAGPQNQNTAAIVAPKTYTPYVPATPVSSPSSSPAPAPAPAPAPSSGGSSAPAAPTPSPFDADPVLQQIKALQEQTYQHAVAAADVQRKQLLIALGDPDMVEKTAFGSLENPTYGDQTTELAAKQNPYSTLANLLFTHGQSQRNINEAENKANLFYSGDRIRQLGNEEHVYGSNVTTARNTTTNALNQITQGLLNTETAGSQAYLDALNAAYGRLVANPGSGGGGGGGGDSSAPAPASAPAPDNSLPVGYPVFANNPKVYVPPKPTYGPGGLGGI